MRDDLETKLKNIKEEDIVLCIFIILFILRLYSNVIERKYLITDNNFERLEYHYLNEFAYLIAIIITIYYIYKNDKNNQEPVVYIIQGCTLIALSLIFYLEIKNKD